MDSHQKTIEGLFKRINDLNKQVKEMSDDAIYNMKVINVLFIALLLQNLLFWLIR